MLILAAWAAVPAHASFHFFRIDQVYSNSDGEVQYVVMRESAGSNGENFWTGHTLVTRNAAGQTKSFTFATDLPSFATASRSVLIATQGFANLGLITPDYIIPARFLPTAGGTLDYAEGTDHVTLPALPSDGATAVTKTGTPTAATPKNFANVTVALTSRPVMNVEFYNANLNHYFMSSLAPDIDALDTGRLPGWVRTGEVFYVYPAQVGDGAQASPVCRILIPPPANSHFFSGSPQECADTLTKFPFMTKETSAAFFINLPATSGANAGVCPSGTVAVYRVFNNRADGNHRYMTNVSLRDMMVSLGGTAEGYGSQAVIMCAVPAAAAPTPPTPTPDPGPPPPPSYCMFYPPGYPGCPGS